MTFCPHNDSGKYKAQNTAPVTNPARQKPAEGQTQQAENGSREWNRPLGAAADQNCQGGTECGALAHSQ